LRVRPVSKKAKAGYLQVGVETYGGGLWHTWFDRDLSLAGRIILKDENGGFTSKLIRIDRPLLRVPSLAIHLERGSGDSFQFNQETEMLPILGMAEEQLNAIAEKKNPAAEVKATSVQEQHHAALLDVLSQELSVVPEDIHDFELHLYDTQPSQFGGIKNEFIFSPRMDNQFSSFCALDALAAFSTSPSYASYASSATNNVNAIALFNHEEVGSVSTTGAESSLLPSLLSRLSPAPSALAQTIARSFLVSSDMTHAVHPNYLGKHEENHAPRVNGGVVIKTNAKQRYASETVGRFLLKKLIERRGGKVQEYEVRNDMACGSTVGPGLSKMGVRTIDIGCPMLSMHSIRETAGTHDVQSLIDLFTSFFEGFAELDAELAVD